MADQIVPVLVLDVTEDEANKLLATIDPLAAMAESNCDALKGLLAETEFADQELTQYLTELANEALQYLPTERANDPQQEWQGMPEFIQENQKSWKKILVHFRDAEALQAFAKLIEQPLTEKSRSVWYPVFVISKGRWKSRLTVKALDRIGVPFRVVIEPQEADQYGQVIDSQKLLLLPFSNLGQGSIPARNWVWDFAAAEGHARHWILDDNIGTFYRLNRNLKTPVASGTIFYVAEDFVDRYSNVGLAGFQYEMFAPRRYRIPPFVANTRCYSCILIDNAIPFRWRGRYNEDTDLSLRVLKAGYCTILFNAFLAHKTTTMKMKGGNTDELYRQDQAFDGRLAMARSLQKQHPDVATITRKWGRWQHQVDYRPFRGNKLIRKPGGEFDGVNNYGMALEDSTPASLLAANNQES